MAANYNNSSSTTTNNTNNTNNVRPQSSGLPSSSTFSFKAPFPVSPASAVNPGALKHRRVSLASPSSPRLVQPWMFRDEMGLQPTQAPDQPKSQSVASSASASTRGDKVPEKKGKMRKIDTSQNSDEAPALEKKPRKKWSSEETQMLVNGCQLHGVGNWKTILQDPDLKFHDRSAVDLKDRFRIYFPDAYKKHYPNARTHLSSTIPSTFADGTSLFEKTRSKRRRPFTEAEDRALKAGYEKHGTTWATIVKDPIFQEQNRRSTDLRDRFRNAFPTLYQAAGYKPRSASKKKAEGPVRAADNQLSMSTTGPVDMISGSPEEFQPEDNQALWLWMPRRDKSPLSNIGSTTKKGKVTAQDDFDEWDSASFTTKSELKPTFSPIIVRTPEYYRQNHASTILSPKKSAVAAPPVGPPRHSPTFISQIPVHVQKSILSLGKRRRACENCRRKKMRCDKSLFQCSQCQKSGVECTFGIAEPRGRTLHRTRRTRSMPNPPKTDMALTSQLTMFPSPSPFPAGKKRNVTNKKDRTKQKILGSQRVQGKANNTVEVGQAQGKIHHKQAVPKTSPVSMRPRSLSFHGPTERDPIFGRPFSRPSSRSSSRPSSRPSSIYNSPISASSPWSKSLASLLEDRIKEHTSPISAKDGFIPSSRLAIPLPLPPVIIARLRRAARERDWGSVGTDNLGAYTVPIKTSSRRTPVRRYSRPPSPHPLSRPSSRSSFSLPLERRSSFSRYSPGPISASSSRHSSRPTSRASYSSYSSGLSLR